MPDLDESLLTPATLRARFPEFVHPRWATKHEPGFTDSGLTNALTAAQLIDSTSTEAALHLAAHLALVAHLEESAEIDGGSGTLTEQTTGPFEQTFANMTRNGSLDSTFERTAYGRAYLLLRRAVPRPAGLMR